jgi:hypothetical protein
MQSSANQVRVPNFYIERNRWLNLCIDLNSFSQEFRSQATPAQRAQQSSGILKSLDQIHLEGRDLRIRKIITSRSSLPQDSVEFSGVGPGAMVGDDIFENGQKVENLPKALDYQPQTYKLNQIVSSEIVRAFLEPPQQQMKTIEDMTPLARRKSKEPLASNKTSKKFLIST